MNLLHPPLYRWTSRTGTTGRKERYRPDIVILEDRCVPRAGFGLVNLASDVPGLAPVTVQTLTNPWGLSYSPTGPFWIAENGSNMTDLLDGRGQQVPLLVTVPPAQGRSTSDATGTVFNGGSGFVISKGDESLPSRFLYATENGNILGWNEFVDPQNALVTYHSSSGASYEGLAIATDSSGQSFLYAADYGNGNIDVFNEKFELVTPPGSFQDPEIPSNFAPFNVQTIGDQLVVTYAQRTTFWMGDGFVDVYDTGGNLISHFAEHGPLNAPWGVALAPDNFGPYAGDLLIGNNADGRINAYDRYSGAYLGALTDNAGNPLVIPGLWALDFGNGHDGGDQDTLFFTAGLDFGQHGLYGAIQPPQKQGADTGGVGGYDPNFPGEPRDYPLPPTTGPTLQHTSSSPVVPTAVLLPLTDSSLALVPTLSTLSSSSRQSETGSSPGQASPLVRASLDSSVTMLVMLSDTTVTTPAIESALTPVRVAQEDSLPLTAFLDLNTANSVRPTRATPGRLDNVPEAVARQDSRETSSAVTIEPGWYETVSHEGSLPVAEQESESSPPPMMQAGVSAPFASWAFLLKPMAFLAVPLMLGYAQSLRRRLEQSAGTETTKQIEITRHDPST
jgi:uncharacterized protein (TIGR03118 family)